MPDPGAGFKYDPVPVSYNKRDVLLFASSIGCTADELHFLYELHPSFSVFPTYPIILPFKTTSQDIIDFYAAQSTTRRSIPDIPPLDPRRVLHGEQHIEFLSRLPPSSPPTGLSLHATVLGVYDKGTPGTVVETEHLLIDNASNTPLTRSVGVSFFVGQGGWGGPKGPKTVNYPPPTGKDRKPDVEYTVKTSPETALLYRLNGDYNPLHATPEPGLAMGFGGPIIHGLFSWNSACHALVKVLGGGNPESIKSFGARFASPVRPGDELVIKGWRMGEVDGEGWEEVRFLVEVKGGKVCLSNGRARMKCVGGGGSRL